MFLRQLSEKEQDFEIFTLNDLGKKNQVDVQLDGNLGRQIGVNIFDKNYQETRFQECRYCVACEQIQRVERTKPIQETLVIHNIEKMRMKFKWQQDTDHEKPVCHGFYPEGGPLNNLKQKSSMVRLHFRNTAIKNK